MARKHNCKHPERGRSHYRDRLIRRGQSGTSVMMRDVDDLRRLQENRTRNTGSPFPSSRELAAEQEQDAA